LVQEKSDGVGLSLLCPPGGHNELPAFRRYEQKLQLDNSAEGKNFHAKKSIFFRAAKN
jgi:hypothetical protein